MRCRAIRRRFTAGAVTTAAVLALPFGAAAAANANPPAEASTITEFQVPIRHLTWCTLTVWVCQPQLTTVTPSATTGTPGEVTFAAQPPYCIDVSVNWRNLTTGGAGTALLRPVPPDYSRPYTPGETCHYTPATAFTGAGTIATTADFVDLGDSQVLITPGVGVFTVP
jgi:hypothetical protein